MKRTIQYDQIVKDGDSIAAQDAAFTFAQKRWPRAVSIKTTVKGQRGLSTTVRVVVNLDNA